MQCLLQVSSIQITEFSIFGVMAYPEQKILNVAAGPESQIDRPSTPVGGYH